jgi:phosphoglycolate phosphatase
VEDNRFSTSAFCHEPFHPITLRVFGSDLDGARVDKVELLRYALDIAKVDPAQAIMIGDRSHDIVGAKRNGMDGIGVLYGYGSREELLEAGAVHLCATPRAILDHLAADSGTA